MEPKGDEMKSGKCPKCSSSNVYFSRDLPLKGGPFGSNSIPISLTSMAPLDNYVCTDCGLVESYISDQGKLKEFARKWSLVSASGDSPEENA
jgi:predicted nucleic-acid-binding Zn-ribbon protein